MNNNSEDFASRFGLTIRTENLDSKSQKHRRSQTLGHVIRLLSKENYQKNYQNYQNRIITRTLASDRRAQRESKIGGSEEEWKTGFTHRPIERPGDSRVDCELLSRRSERSFWTIRGPQINTQSSGDDDRISGQIEEPKPQSQSNLASESERSKF